MVAHFVERQAANAVVLGLNPGSPQMDKAASICNSADGGKRYEMDFVTLRSHELGSRGRELGRLVHIVTQARVASCLPG